jgi:ArsR family transcriptional regulator
MNEELMVFEMQAQLCQSLGHTLRLRIIHALKEGPKSVNEIAAAVSASQPTISRHLAILRSTGLLTTQRMGIEIYYQITNPKVVEICEMMRSLLAERGTQQLELLNRLQGLTDADPHQKIKSQGNVTLRHGTLLSRGQP